ncbi:FabD/lysophospholipase-like protein [Aulographum hederae CBS 113979]|uniref:FabD/lysophospholipase-like protein n=1 Tax=Aulographum hederae CBS 113979 TaxID=1176131 RepID=A0A6G1H5T3_9PEZI|nr:FabD/lysophospholipase-like protein [Aulographum hederae CBS 113979]
MRALARYVAPVPKNGGGVRGLSELIVVEKLMVKIQEQRKLASLPKPCDVFDLICGTSTGGIIALMFGRLRMSVQEAKDQYFEISEKVFGRPKRNFGKGRDQFSATELELILKKTVAEYSGRTTPIRLFRSYKVYDVGTYEEEMTIWQATRATTAAPTFFKQFLDGGLGSNNPTKILLEEMVKIYGDRDVSCIVSIGAGKAKIMEYKAPGWFGKLIPMDLIDALKNMATDCEETESDMSRRFLKRPGVYFRFNVEQGLEEVGMEEW